jgi:hypothetical protein
MDTYELSAFSNKKCVFSPVDFPIFFSFNGPSKRAGQHRGERETTTTTCFFLLFQLTNQVLRFRSTAKIKKKKRKKPTRRFSSLSL